VNEAAQLATIVGNHVAEALGVKLVLAELRPDLLPPYASETSTIVSVVIETTPDDPLHTEAGKLYVGVAVDPAVQGFSAQAFAERVAADMRVEREVSRARKASRKDQLTGLDLSSPAAVADFLAAFNNWRKSGEGELPPPQDISLALEAAVGMLRQPRSVEPTHYAITTRGGGELCYSIRRDRIPWMTEGDSLTLLAPVAIPQVGRLP
jgi:hypothetical protein